MPLTDPADLTTLPTTKRPRGRPPLSVADVTLRRDNIIEAASRLFFTNGFADTKVEDVGRAAGVTKRTIYELIGDKNALFEAACNKLRAQGPHFEFRIPVEGRSVRDVLKHMGEQLVDHSLGKEIIEIERSVIAELARGSESVRKLVHDVIGTGKVSLVGAMVTIFDELLALNMIPPINSNRAAELFYDVAVGARGFRAVIGHLDESTIEDMDERVDMFLNGYLNAMPKV